MTLLYKIIEAEWEKLDPSAFFYFKWNNRLLFSDNSNLEEYNKGRNPCDSFCMEKGGFYATT